MTKIYLSPSTQQHNVGPFGYIEEYAMNKVADLVQPELVRHGVSVLRNKSTQDNINIFIRDSNSWGADYHVAIHSNAMGVGKSGARGAEVFCWVPENKKAAGTRMAQFIYNNLSKITPTSDRGVKDGKHLDEIKYTLAQAMIIEVDFHDTEDGVTWIMGNLEPIATAILMGILEQLEIKYIAKIDRSAQLEREVARLEKQVQNLETVLYKQTKIITAIEGIIIKGRET